MKRIAILCVLAGLAIQWGCGKSGLGPDKSNKTSDELLASSPLLSVDLPIGAVDILGFEIDRPNREMRFEIAVRRPNNDSENRFLSIGPSNVGALGQGGRMTLCDKDKRLLCEVLLDWDVDRPNAFGITERTTHDQLSVRYSIESGTVIESCLINGASREFAHPLPDTRTGLDTQDSLGQPASLAHAPAEFGAFAEPYRGCTLDNNRDGELLIHLVTDMDFIHWAEGQLASTGPGSAKMEGAESPRGVKSYELICGIAGVATLKCFFGAWANFICIAASGTALACSIANIVLALS
jgi:hypothetical protein